MDYFGIFDVGVPELALILLIVLLLFGSKNLPELSRSVGASVRELKKGMREVSEAKEAVSMQVSDAAASLDDREQVAEQPKISNS
jgi:sec-independent protein translocase protein TatA